MNDFSLALWALAVSLLLQALAAGWATEVFVRRGLPAGWRRSWLALAIAAMLFALYHGYTLELALRTGIYDLRQALLGAASALMWAFGVYGFRRQQA